MMKHRAPKTPAAALARGASTGIVATFTASPEEITHTERARLAIELAAEQAEAEADAQPANLAAIVVADEADYTLVTELRTEVRAKKDAAIKLRQTAAQPWKKVATTIEDMFRPLVQAYEKIENDFRGKLEAYQVAKVKAEREARLAATEAATAGDDAALVTALSASTVLARPIADGGRVSLKWTVKRVVADLLPDEYWTPDMAKIEAIAKAHRGDEPPVIPGVVFEQTASVAVKR